MVVLLQLAEPDSGAEQRQRRARALEVLERAHGPEPAPPAPPAGPSGLEPGAAAAASRVDPSALYAPLGEAVASSRLVGRARAGRARGQVDAYVARLLLGEQRRRGNEEERQAARIAEGKLRGKAVLLDDPRALLRARRAAKRKAQRRQGGQAGPARLQRGALQPAARRRGAAAAPPRSALISERDALAQQRSWHAYAEALVSAMGRDDVAQLSRALARGARGGPLELHGAPLRVSRARCASYAGLAGMLVSESARTFRLVSFAEEGEDGRRRARAVVVPTRCCVFAVEPSAALRAALVARGHSGELEVGSLPRGRPHADVDKHMAI